MAGVLGVIWGDGEAEYFCGEHWTKPYVICPTGNATGSSFRQRDLHHGITSPDFSFSRPITVLAEDACAEAAAMNAIAAPKSSALNRLEGFALTFLLQGFPTFASAALLLKLAHHEIAGGVVLFVVMASIFHGLLTPWLAPKFPKFFKHGYEPLFFNASLSFVEKIEKWRAQPTTSLQLVTNVLLLSLLAVGVMSMR
jgi:hypothetical protein